MLYESNPFHEDSDDNEAAEESGVYPGRIQHLQWVASFTSQGI
jgi:hypothetical protein